jgi:hypothetical protein
MDTRLKERSDEDVLLLLDDATVAIEQKRQNGEEGPTGLEHFATLADFITQN